MTRFFGAQFSEQILLLIVYISAPAAEITGPVSAMLRGMFELTGPNLVFCQAQLSMMEV
jgi:hypothetical protein